MVYFKRRRKSGPTFGPDGRRLGCPVAMPSTNRLFQPGQKLKVLRAPIMPGLSLATKPFKQFQHPMLGRRAYKGDADAALRRSTLGPRRSMNGMAKIMQLAGKGLNRPSVQKIRNNDGSDSDSEEEEEEDRPFEPLRVWTSPHQGGEPKGLPSSL